MIFAKQPRHHGRLFIRQAQQKAIVFVVIFALTGTGLVLFSHAATPVVSFEAENGKLSGVTIISDSSASGGSAVRFGAGKAATQSLHYTSNSNFDASGNYIPGSVGFNLADVSSAGSINSLPSGVKALVYLGLCNGADASFQSAVSPFIGNARVFGFYLMDEPDPTGKYKTLCPPANLKMESDWIHTNDPGVKTYILEMNLYETKNPTYQGDYNPANSDIDLYGLDPYPCRTELNGCNYSWITLAVNAANAAGIPTAQIVPTYQAFGLGTWIDDGGSTYAVPTADQTTQIISTWATAVPHPVFDYVYSWGSQNADQSLNTNPTVQQVFAAHNSQ